MTAPKTRAVEVAPALYIVADEVVSVANQVTTGNTLEMLIAGKGTEQTGLVLIRYRDGGYQTLSGITPAEVAAKLWPVEGEAKEEKTGRQVSHQVSLTLERALLDRDQRLISDADFVKIMRDMMCALQEEARSRP